MPNIIRNVEQAMAKFFIRDEYGHDEKNSNIEVVGDWDNQDIKKFAEAEVSRLALAIINGELKVPWTYEDGDQTPLLGKEAVLMKWKWLSGMDHQPHAAFRSEPLFCHYSPLLLHCYLGNYSSFIKLIETLSPEELSLQLKKRETLMKVSPIFQPIIGIRSLTSDLWGPSHVLSETSRVRGRCNLQHKKVFKKLLELGADVNVHDVAGCTPLHYCSSKVWLRRFGPASSTLEMAKQLLEAGADVNAVDRFGATPLMDPVLSKDMDFVKLLLENGADPKIKDVNGQSPYDVGRSDTSGVGWILKIADEELIQEERTAAKEENGLEKCSGCFQQWYCTRDCQKSDWTNHKKACKERKAQYCKVEFEEGPPNAFNLDSGKFTLFAEAQVNNRHSIVKVQVPLTPGSSLAPLMVYNKDRTIFGMVSTNTDFGAKLSSIVRAEGFQGIKGFFYAIKKKGDIFINPSILAPECW